MLSAGTKSTVGLIAALAAMSATAAHAEVAPAPDLSPEAPLFDVSVRAAPCVAPQSRIVVIVSSVTPGSVVTAHAGGAEAFAHANSMGGLSLRLTVTRLPSGRSAVADPIVISGTRAGARGIVARAVIVGTHRMCRAINSR